jgi:hypothetical protein
MLNVRFTIIFQKMLITCLKHGTTGVFSWNKAEKTNMYNNLTKTLIYMYYNAYSGQFTTNVLLRTWRCWSYRSCCCSSSLWGAIKYAGKFQSTGSRIDALIFCVAVVDTTLIFFDRAVFFTVTGVSICS